MASIKARKGDLSIQYMFLIFIGVIALVVIVGMLTDWSFGARRYVGKLTSGDDYEQDIQMVITGDLSGDTEKHVKLCKAKCEQGLVKSNLCYAITDRSSTNLIYCGVDGEAEVLRT